MADIIPIINNRQLVVHPILNFQTRYSFKMLDVACYQDEILFKSSGCDEHIHVANTKTLLFEFPAYLSVFARILYRKFLKEFGNFKNIVEVFFFSRLERTKIKFCQRDVRNLTVMPFQLL